MKLLHRLTFLALLILWIVYAKDTLNPYLLAIIIEPTLSYIATGLVTFFGGWLLWRIILRR